jgi:hypothetical protein
MRPRATTVPPNGGFSGSENAVTYGFVVSEGGSDLDDRQGARSVLCGTVNRRRCRLPRVA